MVKFTTLICELMLKHDILYLYIINAYLYNFRHTLLVQNQHATTKKLRQTEEGLVCDFCKSECQEVQGIEVAKAVGLLMIDAEEICAVNLWHKELLQILNHVSDIRVSATNAQKVIDEMNDGESFPSENEVCLVIIQWCKKSEENIFFVLIYQ